MAAMAERRSQPRRRLSSPAQRARAPILTVEMAVWAAIRAPCSSEMAITELAATRTRRALRRRRVTARLPRPQVRPAARAGVVISRDLGRQAGQAAEQAPAARRRPAGPAVPRRWQARLAAWAATVEVSSASVAPPAPVATPLPPARQPQAVQAACYRPQARAARSVGGRRPGWKHRHDECHRAGRRLGSGLREPWPDGIRLLDRPPRQSLFRDAHRWDA
jgi:hypothetical protein